MNELVRLLHEGRARERAQAAFYRRLSGAADDAGDAARAEVLNELLADEQHHVSRLTARLLELGERPDDTRIPAEDAPGLEGWEEAGRLREAAEVAWYEDALERIDDGATRAILEEILASERHHHANLGGKWMPAGPTGQTGESE
ncbi:MAG: ferritin-like domain-containing protein [Longimicrobiales bacterium]